MKAILHYPTQLALVLVLVLLHQTNQAAPVEPSSASGIAPTNTSPEKIDVTKSTFVVPSSPAMGRDPFYPNSVRLKPKIVAVKPTGETPLVLKTLLGTTERRLAQINNQIFAEGDQYDVTTPDGRTTVRCIQIRDDSVIVEVAGKQRELRMR